MADYYAILTNAGAAALAAKTSSSPVLLASMVLGDGNGASYEPNPAQTALVHELASVAIDAVAIDPGHANWVNISAIVPLDVGGFTIREVGLKLDNGTLFAVVKYPPTLKPAPGDGQEAEMIITLRLVISSTSDITVVASGTQYASQNYVQASKDFVAVISAMLTAPPPTPSSGDAYLVPTGATGAWAGLDGAIAVWFAGEWLFKIPRIGAHVATGAKLYRFTVTGWVELVATDSQAGLVELATTAETIAGADALRAVTPAGLAGLTATASRRGLVELATGPEVIAGTDTERAVTPEGLAALTATSARRGLVELATDAEMRAGVDTDRAATPRGVSLIIGQADSDTFFLGLM
ncbi:phage tail-collar fiber domain-containing protein [Caulobacter sp. RL271]|uniref:Phage tail protein n=1 Tax=Caulobacter segnis TaxID=88688 RepID=A0ABY4ZXG1_9CAUL|nr:phage tail protein [Caulobacter segnis]USQ97241.1 phage tail protein [Caulobacter segnis]